MTSAPDLLATIVAASRRVTEVREAARPAGALERIQAREPRGDRFVAALRDGPPPRVIAECKRRSPSRGILRGAYDAATHARSYAAAGAAAISVLTEPTFFDGDPDDLRAVRAAVDLPILRKDFIVTEYQLVEAAALGADAALLIAGALSARELRRLVEFATTRRLAPLVEVHDRAELDIALDAGATVIGVNSRNLRTLDVDTAVLERIAPAIPAFVTAVAESGIKSRHDIDRLTLAGYHAFLVGERLISQTDPGSALREVRGV